MNIIFVKVGDLYNEKHVNRLYNQINKYYPEANYYCYTENSKNIKINCIPVFKKPTLRSWWNKLAMFSEEFPVKGKCLYFDLDMDIKGDFTNFIKWNGLTITKVYWKDNLYMAPHAYDVHINSSVITWTAGEQKHIWNHFMSNRDYFLRKYAGIDRFIVHEKFSHNVFKDGIINSISNPYKDYAPIDMYNGLKYELT